MQGWIRKSNRRKGKSWKTNCRNDFSRNFPEEDSSSVQESVLNRMINDCDQIIYQLNEKIDNLKDENF